MPRPTATEEPAMHTALDLATATPREIDERLAEIANEAAPIIARAAAYRSSARRYNKAGGRYAALAARYTATADDAMAEARAVLAKGDPLEAECERRGGWTRWFLCASDGGHVHRGRGCPTLRPTTQLGWLPALSGKNEAAAVAEHGAMICTVCCPTAPTVAGYAADAERREAEKAAKRAAQCPGSGTYDHDSSGLDYVQRRARCNHCRQTTSVTSTGKLRGHKPRSA